MKNYFHNLINEVNGNVYVIAEGCDNHMGSLDIAKGMADAAKNSGADAIKFQHHLPDEEMLPEIPISDNFEEPLYDFLKRNALKLSDHFALYDYCNKIGITYLCTPFSFKAATEINEIVPFFKIGSGEFQDHWYLDKINELQKPILLSSGMCTWEELHENISYLQSNDFDFAIMNCLSEYPPNYDDMNIGLITKMKKEFPNIVIGHSDHTSNIYSCISAVTLGAKIIEKHLSLSEYIPGPDREVSISPTQLKDLTYSVKNVCRMLGDNKIVHKNERAIRDWAYRSVISAKEIKKGSIINESDICTKRPGIGIPSKNYKQIIGKKASRNINQNEIIKESDLDV